MQRQEPNYARWGVDLDQTERFATASPRSTDAVKGAREWRIIAQALYVSRYATFEREDERNQGDFAGMPTHPLLADAPPINNKRAEPDHLRLYN
ncbi:hypothetical protein BCY90_01305 [Agrobacterium deltaense]|nr:hypothetical protein L901_01225 [Agrobacterium sp. D14]RKF42995.1 hypothetical protein BCY90_01305 [Agrobacterium deltaense]